MHLSTDILASFPPVDEVRVDALLKAELEKNQKKIVVLDDDPTGVQTVHDISVFTNWDKQSLQEGFAEKNSLFYILTNSRSFTAEKTEAVHREIADTADEAAKEAGKDYLFISRSDSTLRGHYPLEPAVLKERYEKNTGRTVDGEILCPFFKEGGRYTIGNVHYVQTGSELIPANETEFARDKTFGYKAPTMPEYIAEKTGGAYAAKDVICVSLDDIRALAFDKIEEQLLSVHGFGKIIVNAVDYIDVKIFCIALFRAMQKGKNYLFRTAAAIVKVMGGISDQPLLTGEQMVPDKNENGGIIVIGSHTEKTTRQMEKLKELSGIVFLQFDASLVRDDAAFESEVRRCVEEEEKNIAAGRTVCCYTTRALITAETGNKEDDLLLSVKISEGVQSLVGRLSVKPCFIIARGGITSSDVGTKALKVRRATVLGQIYPGIPVWQTGKESKFPSMPYVIFPGNVGDDESLKAIVEKLI